MRAALVACVLAAALPSSAGFFFFATPAHYNCYVEELTSSRTIVHVSYEAGPNIAKDNVQMEVITPRGATIFSEKISRTVGSFQVTTSGTEGPHSFCVHNAKGSQAVRMSIQIEAHQTTGTDDWVEHEDPASGRKFYHNANTKESLWELPEDVKKGGPLSHKDVKTATGDAATTKEEMQMYTNYMKALHALMVQIKEESTYIVNRQTAFKTTSDATASALWYIFIIQGLIVLMMPAIQTIQMKRLFVKKKLV